MHDQIFLWKYFIVVICCFQEILICVVFSFCSQLKFLEVSELSFVNRLGQKFKEGDVNKCSGGRQISLGCCGCLKKYHVAGRWSKRWVVQLEAWSYWNNSVSYRTDQYCKTRTVSSYNFRPTSCFLLPAQTDMALFAICVMLQSSKHKWKILDIEIL